MKKTGEISKEGSSKNSKKRQPPRGGRTPKAEIQSAVTLRTALPEVAELERLLLESPPPRLPRRWYTRDDALQICRETLGCFLWVRQPDGSLRVARIVEAEAYIAPYDEASHAYASRRTARNESMFKNGGTTYVYKCYGVHDMVNFSTSVEEVPHAILLRAGEAVVGLETTATARRQGIPKFKNDSVARRFAWGLLRGPGCLTAGLGITKDFDGCDLVEGDRIWITEGLADRIPTPYTPLTPHTPPTPHLSQDSIPAASVSQTTLHGSGWPVVAGPRIGIGTGVASTYPYRFFYDRHPCVSKPNFLKDASGPDASPTAASSSPAATSLSSFIYQPPLSANTRRTPESIDAGDAGCIARMSQH